MSIVRVRKDFIGVAYDATTDTHVPLKPGDEYDSDDDLVRQHPSVFQRDSDVDAARGVEQATRRPGERRG